MDYEIIKGTKYKKCKEHQERHPKTLRCRNKLIAKPGYEVINQTIYKKCKDNQERHPKTLRCRNLKNICYNNMLEYDGINSCYIDSLLVSLFTSDNDIVYEMFFKNNFIDKKMQDKSILVKEELLNIYSKIKNNTDNNYKCSNLRKLLQDFKKKYNKVYPNNTIDQNNWQRAQSEPVQTLEFLNIILNFNDTTITKLSMWGSNSRPTKKILKTTPITTRKQNSSIIYRISCEIGKKNLNISDKLPNALNITKFDQDNMWKPTSNTKYKYKVEEVELISAKLLFVHIDRLTYDINTNTIVKLETNIKPVRKITLKDNSVKHLHSIIMHSGGIDAGHYTALFKCKKNGNKWFLYDDLKSDIKYVGTFTEVIKNKKYMASCTDLIYI